MSFLDRLTWKEWFIIGGLVIIWALAVFTLLQALSDGEIVTAGFAVIVGVVFSAVLYALITLIDRFL